jgi:aryl-alcohol dehydrogenase-like predicted oxidoreductase
LVGSREEFAVVTKSPAFGTERILPHHIDQLNRVFDESLAKLRRDKIYGLLVHHSEDLLAEDAHLLMEALQGLKQNGRVQKIGVSVYSGSQVEAFLTQYSFDMIQVPLNVFDQRLIQQNYLKRLKLAGIEVHVRSAFLQGLLLMKSDTLPPRLRGYADHIEKFLQFAGDHGCTPAHAALSFVCNLEEVDAVIVGVNSADQLEHLVQFECCAIPKTEFSQFALNDELILNPALWRN